MNRDELTTQQALKLHTAIRPTAWFLRRLRKRLDELGFPGTDPFYQVVAKAEDAVHHLFVETHYLSHPSGAGRPDRDG